MKQPLVFSFRLRAEHMFACSAAPQPDLYRHGHNVEVVAKVTHPGFNNLEGLTEASRKFTQFHDHAVERFNGRDLREQLPTGMQPSLLGLSYYLFTWLDLLFADRLESVRVTVDDFRVDDFEVTQHTREEIQLRLLPQATS